MPHVGVPSAILNELSADLENLSVEVPISLLDLALSAGNIDARPLVRSAFEHISQQHGKEMADIWLRDMLVREQALLITRRHLVATGLAEKLLGDVRHIMVQERAGRLQLTLPKSIALALDSASQLGGLENHIRMLAGSVGAGVDVRPDRSDSDTKVGSPVADVSPRETAAEEQSLTSRDILIIVSGERARAIARHLTSPDWLPAKDASSSDFPRYLLRHNAEAGQSRGGPAVGGRVIDVLSDRALPSVLNQYGVVVWLVDDAAPLHGMADRLRDEFGDRSDMPGDTVLLIAPALPTFEPSQMLLGSRRKLLLDLPFSCIIDTSLARSPFWTGNPRRAIDRRIGDIVIDSAMICAADKQLREDLIDLHSRHELQLFSFAIEPDGPGDPDAELGLLSESSSTGLMWPRKPDLRKPFSRLEVRPFGRSSARARTGYYSIRRHDPNFDGFVQAVIASFHGLTFIDLARGKVSLRRPKMFDAALETRPRHELPSEVERELVHPLLTAAAHSPRPGSGKGIIVTAEAPSLSAVHAAYRAGWAIARYTDRETVWEALDGQSRNPWALLPQEIRLPKLRRLNSNRGLAVRGVDPRDIVRLPLDAFEIWRSHAEGSPLLAHVRRYRTRIDNETVTAIAIPPDAVEEARRTGDPAARALERMLRKDFLPFKPSPQKRPGDLRVAWSPPGNGARRFVLEDGHLPVSMMELLSDFVPVQRLFIIDGDESVPALLTSRLFNIWARATLSRSTSWASRFSVGNTFETLPIPSKFVVRHREAETPELRLTPRAGGLRDLIRKLDNDPRTLGKQPRSDRKNGIGAWIGHPLLEEIDAVLLSMIDLPPGADDLNILDRLLTMNQSY